MACDAHGYWLSKGLFAQFFIFYMGCNWRLRSLVLVNQADVAKRAMQHVC